MNRNPIGNRTHEIEREAILISDLTRIKRMKITNDENQLNEKLQSLHRDWDTGDSKLGELLCHSFNAFKHTN